MNHIWLDSSHDRRQSLTGLRPVRRAGFPNAERDESPMPQPTGMPSVRTLDNLNPGERPSLFVLALMRYDVIIGFLCF
jgi:hypothetical protein